MEEKEFDRAFNCSCIAITQNTKKRKSEKPYAGEERGREIFRRIQEERAVIFVVRLFCFRTFLLVESS